MSPVAFTSEPFTYPGGGIAAGVQVHVFRDGTTVRAPIYHDTLGVRAPNPVRTDVNGRVSFYAEPGTYDLVANGVTSTVVVLLGQPTYLGGDQVLLAFSMAGNVAAGVGKARIYNDSGLRRTIAAVRASAVNVSGSNLVLDVNKNDVSIFTNQSNRPTLPPAPDASSKVTAMDVNTWDDGEYLTVDVDAVGAASNLTVQILTR